MADVVGRDVEPENPEVHHEATDANVRSILTFAAAFTGMAIVVFLVVFGLYKYFERTTARQQGRPISQIDPDKARVPPEPRLQVLQRNPIIEMQQLREREDRILNTYGIADRSTGAVRIPIDEAMKLALQRPGMFPVRAESVPPALAPTDAGVPAGMATTAPAAGSGLPPPQRPFDERSQVPPMEAEKQPGSRP